MAKVLCVLALIALVQSGKLNLFLTVRTNSNLKKTPEIRLIIYSFRKLEHGNPLFLPLFLFMSILSSLSSIFLEIQFCCELVIAK